MKLAFYNTRMDGSSGNGAWFDSAIEFRQYLGGAGYAARFVHCELVFDEVVTRAMLRGLIGITLGGDANGSLCYSSSPRDGGVRFKWIDLTDGKWALVNLGSLSSGDLSAALAFCQARVGLRYDWLGILGFALPFGEHDDNDRFCSESSVEVMQRSLIGALPMRIRRSVEPLVSWRTNPARLYQAVAASVAISESTSVVTA